MLNKGDKEQAFNDYKRGFTHRENAEKQGVSVNTVKSWCKRYEWRKRKQAEDSVHLFKRRLHKIDV